MSFLNKQKAKSLSTKTKSNSCWPIYSTPRESTGRMRKYPASSSRSCRCSIRPSRIVAMCSKAYWGFSVNFQQQLQWPPTHQTRSFPFINFNEFKYILGANLQIEQESYSSKYQYQVLIIIDVTWQKKHFNVLFI